MHSKPLERLVVGIFPHIYILSNISRLLYSMVHRLDETRDRGIQDATAMSLNFGADHVGRFDLYLDINTEGHIVHT